MKSATTFHILGHVNPPNNVPWRRLEVKYCSLTFGSRSYSLTHAKAFCYQDAAEGCESIYQADGCKGNYKLCKAGYIRDPHVGTEQPSSGKDIGCILFIEYYIVELLDLRTIYLFVCIR